MESLAILLFSVSYQNSSFLPVHTYMARRVAVTCWPSEADREVEAVQQQILTLPEIERRDIVGVIETDLGTDHHEIVELMAQADGVARIVRREARPLALLIAPPLVAEREIIPLRDRE